MKFSITTPVGSCGILDIYGYDLSYSTYSFKGKYLFKFNSCAQYKQHAGFLLASFIQDKVCKQMYKNLASKFPILYQSPVRKNDNSGNRFFFVIFDIQEG